MEIAWASPFCKSMPQISLCFALVTIDDSTFPISLACSDWDSVDRAADMANHPTDHRGSCSYEDQKVSNLYIRSNISISQDILTLMTLPYEFLNGQYKQGSQKVAVGKEVCSCSDAADNVQLSHLTKRRRSLS